jgi:hypothetical protein
VSEGPNPAALGPLVAEHLPPILYALEVCALQMEGVGRSEEADYYRALARRLSEASATPREEAD